MKKLLLAVFALLTYGASHVYAQGTFQALDLEFERHCMVDSVSQTQQVEFWRLVNINTGIWKDEYFDAQDSVKAYTIVGTPKTCEGSRVADMMQFCDLEEVNFAFEYVPVNNPESGFVESNLQINSDILDFSAAVSTMTVDCGQGQVSSSRVASCNCDFNNVPDGFYYPQVAIYFRTGGAKVLPIGVIQVADGNVVDGSITLSYSQNVVKSSTPFIRKYNQDNTFSDFEIDGVTPYTVNFVSGSCDIDNGTNDILTPSTRPDLKIANQECWKQDFPVDTYNDHEVIWTATDPFKPVFGQISLNPPNDLTAGVAIPTRENDLSKPNAEQYFIEDIGKYLTAQGLKYHSVTVDVRDRYEYVIRINQLESSVTGFFLAPERVENVFNGDETPVESYVTSTDVYQQDTSFYFDVTRYQFSGNQALVIDAYGQETYLPADAYKVRCGGGIMSVTDTPEICNTIGIAGQDELNGNSITYDANTINSVTLTVVMGEILVTTTDEDGVTKTVPYGTGWTKNWDEADCKLFTTPIIIDATNGYGITAVKR